MTEGGNDEDRKEVGTSRSDHGDRRLLQGEAGGGVWFLQSVRRGCLRITGLSWQQEETRRSV